VILLHTSRDLTAEDAECAEIILVLSAASALSAVRVIHSLA